MLIPPILDLKMLGGAINYNVKVGANSGANIGCNFYDIQY